MGFLPVDDVCSPEGSISEHHPICEKTDRKSDDGFVPVICCMGKQKVLPRIGPWISVAVLQKENSDL